VETLSGHLSVALVSVGRRVAAGTPIGRVGATGRATGPHQHFELLVRGARVDPLGALG
jgi:murein DD-endopeptidase MepM/ murein hydrolase activator NlpD